MSIAFRPSSSKASRRLMLRAAIFGAKESARKRLAMFEEITQWENCARDMELLLPRVAEDIAAKCRRRLAERRYSDAAWQTIRLTMADFVRGCIAPSAEERSFRKQLRFDVGRWRELRTDTDRAVGEYNVAVQHGCDIDSSLDKVYLAVDEQKALGISIARAIESQSTGLSQAIPGEPEYRVDVRCINVDGSMLIAISPRGGGEPILFAVNARDVREI